jgi:acyl carrier protein
MVGFYDIKPYLEICSYRGDFDENSYLIDLEMDELDWYDLIMRLEDRYKIKFNDSDDTDFINGYMRVQDVVDLVNQKLNNHE